MEPIIANPKPENNVSDKFAEDLSNDKTCINSDLVTQECLVFSDNFECPICTNIAFDPVTCSECKGLFGKKCLDSCLLNSDKCPRAGCPNFKPIKNDHTSMKILSILKFKCAYPDCNNILNYENFYSHIEKCIFKSYRCKGEGCKFVGNIEDISIHVEFTCEKSLKKCEYCNELHVVLDFEEHLKKCDYKPVSCEYCTKKVFSVELNKHIKDDCLQVLVQCKYCKEMFLREKIKSHEDNREECNKTIEKIIRQEYDYSSDIFENELKLKNAEITKLQKKKEELIIVLSLKENFNKEYDLLKSNYTDIINKLKDEYIHSGELHLKPNQLNYEVALTYFMKAYEYDKKSEIINFNIGRCLNELKRYNEAIDYFNKAVAVNESSVISHFGIGNSLQNLQKFEEAILSYKTCIKFNSNLAMAYYCIAYCYETIKKESEALDYYLQYYKIQPNDFTKNKIDKLLNKIHNNFSLID